MISRVIADSSSSRRRRSCISSSSPGAISASPFPVDRRTERAGLDELPRPAAVSRTLHRARPRPPSGSKPVDSPISLDIDIEAWINHTGGVHVGSIPCVNRSHPRQPESALTSRAYCGARRLDESGTGSTGATELTPQAHPFAVLDQAAAHRLERLPQRVLGVDSVVKSLPGSLSPRAEQGGLSRASRAESARRCRRATGLRNRRRRDQQVAGIG